VFIITSKQQQKLRKSSKKNSN